MKPVTLVTPFLRSFIRSRSTELLGKRQGAEAAAEPQHEPVGDFAAQGSVYLAVLYVAVSVVAYVKSHRSRPFPVAAVRKIYYHAAAFGGETVYQFDVLELHAALYLGVGYVQKLDCLHYIIGEVAVKFLLDIPAVGLVSVGEAGGKGSRVRACACSGQHGTQSDRKSESTRREHASAAMPMRKAEQE